jgi:hypothetical protein
MKATPHVPLTKTNGHPIALACIFFENFMQWNKVNKYDILINEIDRILLSSEEMTSFEE